MPLIPSGLVKIKEIEIWSSSVGSLLILNMYSIELYYSCITGTGTTSI